MLARRHWLWIVLGLFVGTFIILVALRFVVAPLDRFDEGVTVTKAALVAAGRVPYRDFWITYGPLDTYLLSAAFGLFGTDVLVERCLAIALTVLFSLAGYLLMTSLGLRGAMRLLLTGLLALVPLSASAFGSSSLVNLFGLAALILFLKSLVQSSRRWPALCGALTALASFSRPEFAASLGTGIIAGYIVLAVKQRTNPAQRLIPYMIAIGLVGAALWVPVVLIAGPGPVFHDLVIYAVRWYPEGRSIPLGQGRDGLAVALFSCAFVLVWLWSIVRAVRHAADPAEQARFVGLLVAGILVFTWVRTRADAEHALGAWPVTAVLLALLMIRRSGLTRTNARLDAVASVVAVVVFNLVAAGLVFRDLAPLVIGEPSLVSRASLIGPRAWISPDLLARVVERIDQEVPQGQPIFVGLKRNDLVVFNDTMLYFLSDRMPGTVYYEFLPGFTNSEGVQQTMICQLQRSGVTLAVLGPNSVGEPWNLSSREGSPLVDQWLGDRTVSRNQLGPYDFVRLRPDPPTASCPDRGLRPHPASPASGQRPLRLPR